MHHQVNVSANLIILIFIKLKATQYVNNVTFLVYRVLILDNTIVKHAKIKLDIFCKVNAYVKILM